MFDDGFTAFCFTLLLAIFAASLGAGLANNVELSKINEHTERIERILTEEGYSEAWSAWKEFEVRE